MTLQTSTIHELSQNAKLLEQTKIYISKSKSKNTKKAYSSDWKDFSFWCNLHTLDNLPANETTIAAYLADRAANHWNDEKGKERPPLKAASLQRRLAAIRQAHLTKGYPLNRENPIIASTLRGIFNEHGTTQMTKSPIMSDDLRSMLAHLNESKIGLRDRAILLLGYVGALRRGEIVALKFEDIVFKKEGIELLIRKSKTDQTKKGDTLPIPYGSNPKSCPVRAVGDWLEISTIKEGPLFRSIDRHGNIKEKALSCAAIALIIKRNPHISDSKNSFSGHSLRAGFCTQAASNGVPEHAIMRQSRHKKSDTLKKYIRIADRWKDCAAMRLGL